MRLEKADHGHHGARHEPMSTRLRGTLAEIEHQLVGATEKRGVTFTVYIRNSLL